MQDTNIRAACVCCRAAEPNAALALIVAYTAFYMQLDPFAGITWALTTGLVLWLSSTALQVMVRKCDAVNHVQDMLVTMLGWLPTCR